jgi:conjugative transfer signal peptidase TraF
MMARSRLLAVMMAGVAVLLGATFMAASPRLVWNATASMPLGLYRVIPPSDIRRGDLVLIRPDAASSRLYADRGYLPRGVPLLKRIAATGGQIVCEQNGRISIDDHHVADALAADGKGRPLRAWEGCRTLAADEMFVLLPEVPTSLDGRYFGPTPIASVVGRAVPLWVQTGR